MASEEVIKCTRCRVKRTNENAREMERYRTCLSCRNKRKVVKAPIEPLMDNTYGTYSDFLMKLKANTDHDLIDCRFVGDAGEEFTRFDSESVIPVDVYQEYAKRLTELYIHPIIDATGFKFVVRDFHKGGRKTKKITFQFVCSQDRSKQRRSRSKRERNIMNRLKVEECDSRINMMYMMSTAQVSISFTHRTHAPYGSRAVQKLDAFKGKPPAQLIEHSLQPVAHYNNQYHQPFQPFTDQSAVQALAAVATSSFDKQKMENIDRELIGLQGGE